MKLRLTVIGLFAVAVFIFFFFGLHQYVSLDYLKTQQAMIVAYYHANPVTTGSIFFAIYIAITALSLPGAAIMTLAGGVIFGLFVGTLIVSFASTIGATLAFLLSRFLFRDFLQKKFAERLQIINQGIKEDGALYLFTLRLVPIFPFFIVNLLMALTPIKTSTFFIISQIGMLAGTVVYVYAGTQIAKINALEDILSVELLVAFCLIGLLPLISKKATAMIRIRLKS